MRNFTVKGSGSFPFELLWLDACFPASAAEAEKLTLACPTVAPAQTIALTTTRRAAPSHIQWREAGWPVQRVDA